MNIYFDIETLPTESPEVAAVLAEKITPPKTMSKPETIAKWEVEEKPALVAEAVAKTALDGTYGSVCVIAWAIDDGPVTAAIGIEHSILDFYMELQGAFTPNSRPVFIGHNVTWDLRFLWQRSVINQIKPPLWIPFDSKPWGEHIADTMNMWNPDTQKRISLDRLCAALGVKSSKDGMDGSMVAETWKTDPQKVVSYCVEDVRAIRECYKRMVFA